MFKPITRAVFRESEINFLILVKLKMCSLIQLFKMNLIKRTLK